MTEQKVIFNKHPDTSKSRKNIKTKYLNIIKK